jgi:hypothetical protein
MPLPLPWVLRCYCPSAARSPAPLLSTRLAMNPASSGFPLIRTASCRGDESAKTTRAGALLSCTKTILAACGSVRSKAGDAQPARCGNPHAPRPWVAAESSRRHHPAQRLPGRSRSLAAHRRQIPAPLRQEPVVWGAACRLSVPVGGLPVAGARLHGTGSADGPDRFRSRQGRLR